MAATVAGAHDYFALAPRPLQTPKRPARVSRLGSQACATPGTPSTPARTAHRLLYRGALALADSHLVLDGLTFVAGPSDGPRTPGLLESPLALALESMRGRPSVRLRGEARLDGLSDAWLDEAGDVSL
jgi:hypothetical protein